MTEIEIVNYISNNKDFLKEFHNIYFNIQRDFLSGYSLKNYMITQRIRYNQIANYTDYESYKQQYFLQLDSNLTTAKEWYKSYYNCFVENMEEYLAPLQQKYNKDNNDIKIAYEIKTIWQSYLGFLDERYLIEAINSNSFTHSVYERNIQNKTLLDNNYAVDIELIDKDNNIKAIQCKQLSYLRLDSNKKEIHLNKHKRYRERFSSLTYYVLFQDNTPCYWSNSNNEKHYLILSDDILHLSYKSLNKGSFEELTWWLDNNNLKEVK